MAGDEAGSGYTEQDPMGHGKEFEFHSKYNGEGFVGALKRLEEWKQRGSRLDSRYILKTALWQDWLMDRLWK